MFNYNFLDENVREVSWRTKIWGVTVKFVSGYQPSLYSCQRSLPRLPVPRLHGTLSELIFLTIFLVHPFGEKISETFHFENVSNLSHKFLYDNLSIDKWLF